MIYVPSEPVVILSAARTPQSGLGGPLERFTAVELGGFAARGALERARIDPERIDEAVFGNVVSAGLGHAPAKQAALAAGVPHERTFRTVNTVCASGMSAILGVCLSLEAGLAEVALAGGMESRSGAPYYLGPFDADGRRLPGKVRGTEFRLKTPRREAPAGQQREFIERLRGAGIREASILDSLACPWCDGLTMRDYAERFAEREDLSLEEVNEAAAESYARARAARDGGDFAREISPAGDVAADEIISREREGELRGISYGYVTAFNAPQLGDGAAAVVLCRESTAEKLGLEPAARILSVSRVDTPPQGFVKAPVEALEAAAEAAGARATLVEANESFGLQIPLIRRGFPADEMNPYGGAVALGHPVGAAGARVVVTLLNAMRARGHRVGAATICFGSGGAMAAVLEAL